MNNVITMNPLARLLDGHPDHIRGMFGELHYTADRVPHFPSEDVVYRLGLCIPDIAPVVHEYLFEIYPGKKQFVLKPVESRSTTYSDFKHLDNDIRAVHYDIVGRTPNIPKSMFAREPRKEVFDYVELDANIRNACYATELAAELSVDLITLAHVGTVHIGLGIRFKTEPHPLAELSKTYKDTVDRLSRWGYTKPEFLDQIPATGSGDYKFTHFGREVLYKTHTGETNRDGLYLGRFQSAHALVAHLNVIGNRDK